MLDSMLISTSNLLDATLTLVSLQEQSVLAEESGKQLTEEKEAEIDDALDYFYELLEDTLDSGDSQVLEQALEALLAAGKTTECTFLESAVENAACENYDEAGNRLSLKLMPILVSKEYCNIALTPVQCSSIAQVFIKHNPHKSFHKVLVSPQLLDPSEVYSWRFTEVHAMNLEQGANLRGLVSRELQDFHNPIWHPAFKFLAIRTIMDVNDADDFEFNAHEEPVSLLLGENDLPFELEVSNILTIPYGTPLLAGPAASVYSARVTGMKLYADKVARMSVNRQVRVSGQTAEQMVLTYHTEEFEGPDSLVSQIRIAVVDSAGAILAGHIIECNDWLTLEDGMDITKDVCAGVGLGALTLNEEILEIREDFDELPFFQTDEGWAQLPSDSLRLQQWSLQ